MSILYINLKHYLAYSLIGIFAAAVVGLERPSYTVSEDEGMVEVCAIVTSPDIMCPTEFSFQVNFSTTDGTAGVRGHSSTNIIIQALQGHQIYQWHHAKYNHVLCNCVVSSALDYYRELSLYMQYCSNSHTRSLKHLFCPHSSRHVCLYFADCFSSFRR